MGYFDKFNSKGIPFMDGATKGDIQDILGERVHVIDFGFISGDDGDYGVMQIAEREGEFFFANGVITDMLKQVQADGMKAELPQQAIVFDTTASKKGREYTKFEFVGD